MDLMTLAMMKKIDNNKNSSSGSGGSDDDDGENEIFLVKFSYNEETGNLDQCDKTFEEINEAWKQNKFIRGYIEHALYDENNVLSSIEPISYLYLNAKGDTFVEPPLANDTGPTPSKVCFIFLNTNYEFVIDPDTNNIDTSVVIQQILVAEDNTLYDNNIFVQSL